MSEHDLLLELGYPVHIFYISSKDDSITQSFKVRCKFLPKVGDEINLGPTLPEVFVIKVMHFFATKDPINEFAQATTVVVSDDPNTVCEDQIPFS